MFSEIAVTTSTHPRPTNQGAGQIHIWDVRSGALLASLKGNTSDKNCTALRPSRHAPILHDAIICAQNDKAILSIWSFGKVCCLQKRCAVPDALANDNSTDSPIRIIDTISIQICGAREIVCSSCITFQRVLRRWRTLGSCIHLGGGLDHAALMRTT